MFIYTGEGGKSSDSRKKMTLDRPNKAVGDRKRLLQEMKKLPKQYEKPVTELIEKLDDLLVEGPSAMEEMEALEADVEVVLEAVRRYAKGEKGTVYDTPVIDVMGAPKDSSSIVTYEKMIGNKILPFLRSHLQEKRPGFRVTDLLAFGKPNFTRVHEDMVLECNRNVGKTSSTKRGILANWTVLLRAIGEAARDCIDELGDDKTKRLVDWYEDLAQRVGHGVTRMKSFYERARVEKSQSQYTQDQMPMDQVIRKWLHSEERSQIHQQLMDTAKLIKREGGGVQITARMYSSLSEYAQTELSAYGPVRIGAVARMTVRAFLQSEPAWSANEHRFDRTRPVTLPPPDACIHQTNPKANIAAKCGLTETGDKCCEQAIPPTCFLMRNDKDKGGKSNSYIALTAETHDIVANFLTVRDHYFQQVKEIGSENLQGNCAIFLSAKGKQPRDTSDFKLALFNKAVFGEKAKRSVTSQDLRKWNTTFLQNHPDAQVAANRGEATGNSDTVFQQYYNLAKQSGVFEALKASQQRHRDVEAPVQWSQENDERRKKDKAAMEEANEAMKWVEDGTDLTSKSKPIHLHLRKQFRDELERVEPGLWQRAGGAPKGMALSEMKWVYAVVAVLGRAESEHLRDVIMQQYRGNEDTQRRRWCSLFSHLVREGIRNHIHGKFVYLRGLGHVAPPSLVFDR